MNENSGKKLLIVRLSSLGDCVFNIPMANLFKKNGYRVDWIVSEKGYDIIKDNDAISSVLITFGIDKTEKIISEMNNYKFLL